MDFLTLSKEDEDFRNAFHKIGIFSENELKEDFNEDLEEEFNKERENCERDEELYE